MEFNTSDISNNLINNNDTDDTDQIWKPNIFVLGPGGAKGYLELGLILKFEQEDYLSQVNCYIGCSVGASISLLTVAGYPVTEIINDYIDMNLVNDITDVNIERFNESPGLLSNKTVEKLLKTRIKEKYGMIPTLKQLYMTTGILLVIVTFNLDKMRKEYLTKDSDPNLSCVKAVMMSMAVPALICPRIYNGNVYVDGAVGDPYPVLFMDNGINDILGVYIDSEHSSHSSDSSIPRYLYRCAQASMNILRDQAIEMSSERCKHISLKTAVTDITGISLTNDVKRTMIENGYRTGAIFLMRMKDPVKYQLLLNENEELPVVGDITNVDGVLDTDTEQLLQMLSNDNYDNDHMVFNSESDEDLFISDLGSEENEDTIMIPITPEFSQNIERMRRYRNHSRN